MQRSACRNSAERSDGGTITVNAEGSGTARTYTTTFSNCASVADNPIPGGSPRNPMGVAALTLPAAREFAQFGVRVLAIAPGIFGTPMLRALPQATQDSLGASVPFPKRLGAPREFAALVLHCIHNSYLNGEVIRLDGALRMAPR